MNFKSDIEKFEKDFLETELKRISEGKSPSRSLLKVQFLREKKLISALLEKGTPKRLVWKFLHKKEKFSGTCDSFYRYLRKYNLLETHND